MNKYILVVSLVFEISVILYLLYISIANKKRVYQTTRLLGPKTHKVKDGTITMGGVIFVLVTTIMYLLFSLHYQVFNFHESIVIITAFLGMSLVGFIDDYLKVVKKNNLGISSRLKLFLQIIISSICFIFMLKMNINTSIDLYFIIFDLKWFYGLLILFYIVGYSNASNLTDGLDGLCAGVSIIILGFIFVISYKIGNYNISLFLIILISSLFGFLLFNFKKAQIFMGDTGSLAIGGIIGVLGFLLKIEIVIILLSLVMVIETLSVIMQVSYFKLTKGKRIFKMSPIHHHFELSGFSEKTVVIMFYLVSIVVGLLGLYILGIL